MLAPNRWVMPTGALTFIALINLVAWATVAGGPDRNAHADPPARAHTHTRVLPPVGPAPLAALATTSSMSASTLAGGAVTSGSRTKSAAARQRRSSTATTLHASASTINDTAEASALAQDGIPVTALQAYKKAAARELGLNPSCGLTWPLLAAIGRVESDHGRFAGAVLHADGLSTPPVIGIALNGRNGTTLIRDTDNGRLDGDPVYDHAVGPMQFIPSTWAGWGVDANHDGVADPFNIFDAAAAAANYLCAAGGNLTTYAGQVQAVRSYNDSGTYVALVLSVERVYAAGVGVVVPVAPGTGASGPGPHTTLPPVNPGKPPGIGKGTPDRHRSHLSHSSSSRARRSPSQCPAGAASPSPSQSVSRSPSGSASPSGPRSAAQSSSASRPAPDSGSTCPSNSGSASLSGTKPASPSGTKSGSPSGRKSSSASGSPSGTKSASASDTKPASPSDSRSASRSSSAASSGRSSRSSPSSSPPTSAAPLPAD